MGGRSVAQILAGTFGVKAISPTDPGIRNLAAIRTGYYPEIAQRVTITPTSEALQLLGRIPDPLANLPDPFAPTGFEKTLLKGSFGLITGALGVGAFAPRTQTPPPTGGRMGFTDGSSGGIFDSFPSLPDLTQVFQGGLGQNLLNLGTQAASQYITQQFAPSYSPFNTPSPGGAIPTMAAVPAIARGGMVVGRAFFNRFPNLATVIQGLRNQGKNVTRSKLWSLMKRFGPDFLISGGILTAAAASELAMAGPGRRRMNPGNIKALRKAHRRMKSFHHICATNDTLLHSRRRKAAPANFGGTRITQVK
jgi:hypothetical protein